MKSYLILIPSVDPVYTNDCLRTIDPPIRKHVLIVDNSKKNLGVPASWNIGAKQVVNYEMDYLIIVSASMRFNDGMQDLINALETASPYGLETQHAWHCMVLGRPVFELIGYFDENFYPAYYEDSDYLRRMELAEIHKPLDPDCQLPRHTLHAWCVQDAAAHLNSGIKVNFNELREYFIKKWGHEPLYDSQASRDLMYDYPFNDPLNELSYCEPKDEARINSLRG